MRLNRINDLRIVALIYILASLSFRVVLEEFSDVVGVLAVATSCYIVFVLLITILLFHNRENLKDRWWKTVVVMLLIESLAIWKATR